ncbi:hypothetical protein [Aquibium microcysteis]|nr:hypothetical protein [Aquibium microcysteis]
MIDQFFRNELDQLFERQQCGNLAPQISWTGALGSATVSENSE